MTTAQYITQFVEFLTMLIGYLEQIFGSFSSK